MPDRPALYWYKHPRLIQRANRRCFWLLVPATLCAIILVRGAPLTLALPAAVFLPVLVALAGREIGNAFIGAKAAVARIDHDGLALALARLASRLGGNRLNWQRYWPELQDVDFRYDPQQLVLKYRDGNSEYGDTPKASDKARRRRKYEALGGWLYIHTAPVLDEHDNHDLYLALSRLHGHTEPLPAHIAADRTIAAELEELHREAFAADLAELAASSTQAPPCIRPFG